MDRSDGAAARRRLQRIAAHVAAPAAARTAPALQAARTAQPPDVEAMLEPTRRAEEAQDVGEQKTEDLQDEYGVMDDRGRTYFVGEFALQCGRVMRDVEVRYNCWGTLSPARDNALVVCHALTGNSHLRGWWGGMLGPGKAFDTDKYFVVCANVLGSCYGTTGPSSRDPDDPWGRPYAANFPAVTLRDTVRLHELLLKRGLGVRQVRAVVGGSMGGMQALEWAFVRPLPEEGAPAPFVSSLVVLSANARHSAWQIGISEAQRQAIYADPNWRGGFFEKEWGKERPHPTHPPPTAGLAVARMIAMLSYRSHEAYDGRFGRARRAGLNGSSDAGRSVSFTHEGSRIGQKLPFSTAPQGIFEVESYLRHQGRKFIAPSRKFNANTYVQLTQILDSHDIAAGRGDGSDEAYFSVLRSITQPMLVVAVDSDILYPQAEQEELVLHTPNSQLHVIHSNEGHDGFLLEQDAVQPLVTDFLARELGLHSSGVVR